MRIQIPKVVLPVPMSDYAPPLEGQSLFVWVNPPKDQLKRYDDLVTELQQRELARAKETLLAESAASGEAPKGILAKTFDQLTHWLKVKGEGKSEGVDEKLLAWYAEIWSQGPDDSRWTVEELRDLEEQDPSFLSWMISTTWKVRSEHLERKKKA